jgi:hypothetical protein
MVIASLSEGLRQAARTPRLAVTLWAWNLALAAGATAPLARWLAGALPRAPEADVLAERFSVGVLSELLQDAGPALTLVWTAVAAAVVLAVLGSGLVAGGMLEVLGGDDGRPFLHRFGRGAGRFFGRFLRLQLLALVAAAVAGLLGAVVSLALGPLRESHWEPAAVLSLLIVLGVVLFGLAVAGLALDYARIRVSLDGSRRMLRAYLAALHLVARQLPRTAGLWLLSAGLLLAAAAAYLAFTQAVPSSTTPFLALTVLAQQAFALLRAGLRVAAVAGERSLYERLGGYSRR